MRGLQILLGSIGRWAVRGAFCCALVTAGARIAAAQEIEPNEFVPAPDGTNIAIAYYVYGHNDSFNLARRSTIRNSALEVNIGIARYVHYAYIGGHPAGFQILEAFGSESGGHIGAQNLGSTFGASNPALSAFIWPYANVEKKQYLVFTGFLYPPVGSYDKYAGLNVAGALSGSYGWVGDVQVGWDQGIGEHFSYDASIDVRGFADTTGPSPRGSVNTHKNPDFRLQFWANYNWTRAFQTSIGWESILGGTAYTNRIQNGTKSEFERIRAAASMFVAPNAQLLVEVNHDFVAVGGFNQAIGATGRVVFIF